MKKRASHINVGNAMEGTPLMWAAMKGHTVCVEWLLQNGAKVDGKDREGRTALQHASRKGHYSIVESLLKHRATTDMKDSTGSTATERASENGYNDIVQLLQTRTTTPKKGRL